MDKENIYEYVLGQKHLIEMESLKINSQYQITNIFPDTINEHYDQLNKSIELVTNELNNLKEIEEERVRIKQREILKERQRLIEEEREREKENKKINNMFLSFEYIKNMLSTFPNGTYGVINYYYDNNNTNSVLCTEYILNFISEKKIEYYNKPLIVKKLIDINIDKKKKKYKFTDLAIEEAYGFVFLYTKDNNEITDLNKVYLLKNGDINFINKKLLNQTAKDEEEDAESNSESGEDDEIDNIITKIYNFVSDKKIVLKEIIYESNFQTNYNLFSTLDDTTDKTSIDTNTISDITDTTTTLDTANITNIENKLNDLKSKKKDYEVFIKLIKKYKKYLNDNVKSEDIKETLNNFTTLKTLVKKISDPTKHILDINNLMNYNWSNKFNNIKISNKYNESEYNNLIIKYFDENIIDIVNNLLDTYNLNILFKKYMYVFIELLIRIYIDDYIVKNEQNHSYCLRKDLCDYLNLASVMSEPDTQTQTLKKRYWTNALESEDNKRIITCLINIINSKTHTLDQTLKYLSSFEISII